MENKLTTVPDILAEAERVKQYLEGLGYDSVDLLAHDLYSKGRITLCFYCTDDFQQGVNYEARKQYGGVSIEYLSGDESKLLNREQRELHVLLAQQGESTAIAAWFKPVRHTAHKTS